MAGPLAELTHEEIVARLAVGAGSSPNLRGKALEQLALKVGGYLNVLSLGDDEIRSWLCRFKRPFEGKGELFAAAERLKKRCDDEGVKVLFLGDKGYPVRLREIYKPPLLLYYKGELPEVFGCLDRKVVAVVGTRSVLEEVEEKTFDWADYLTEKGFYVVSGMALGVDAFAHWGALKSGATSAVLGGGVDTIYPYGNAPLYREILSTSGSAILSEHPPGTRPMRYHFPLRNRIISGLSDAVLLMQSTVRGGGMITARYALEQNREVVVYKGGGLEAFSGNEWLAEQGARSACDLGELGGVFGVEEGKGEAQPVAVSSVESQVIGALSQNEMSSIEDLAQKLPLKSDDLAGTLLRLVLKGFVGEAPGKRYYKKRAAEGTRVVGP